MLRDLPFTLWFMIIGIFLIIILGMYYQTNFKQDSVVLSLTETIRTTAIHNADNSSRINPGELYISITNFEQDFIERMSTNSNGKISEDATYKFYYLTKDNGAIKAIKVLIKDGPITYQVTAKVTISET